MSVLHCPPAPACLLPIRIQVCARIPSGAKHFVPLIIFLERDHEQRLKWWSLDAMQSQIPYARYPCHWGPKNASHSCRPGIGARFPEYSPEHQKRTVAESRVLPNRTSAYLTDPICSIPMFQLLPHAALTPNSTRPASYVPSLPSSVQQNFISACEPGTTNLIPLTEIAVSLPFPALSRDITCGRRFPSLHVQYSIPLGLIRATRGPVRSKKKRQVPRAVHCTALQSAHFA